MSLVGRRAPCTASYSDYGIAYTEVLPRPPCAIVVGRRRLSWRRGRETAQCSAPLVASPAKQSYVLYVLYVLYVERALRGFCVVDSRRDEEDTIDTTAVISYYDVSRPGAADDESAGQTRDSVDWAWHLNMAQNLSRLHRAPAALP